MNIPKSSKIEAIPPREATRYSSTQVVLDAANRRLLATDGRCLAVVPCSVADGDTSGPIAPAAIKAARKLAGRASDATIEAGKDARLLDGTAYPRKDDGLTTEQIVLCANGTIPPEGRKPVFRVALNAALLLKLAEAAGNADGIVLLSIYDGGGPDQDGNP